MSSSGKVIAALTLTKFIAVLAITIIAFQASAEESGAVKDEPLKSLICDILPKCKDRVTKHYLSIATLQTK